mmetsp:Transcript_54521/g.143588  ORF Transcript_54521/g.143588 Transcript_54521/m.143588 type:complete len:279 (+) Transcript_54521:63-899(+)
MQFAQWAASRAPAAAPCAAQEAEACVGAQAARSHHPHWPPLRRHRGRRELLEPLRGAHPRVLVHAQYQLLHVEALRLRVLPVSPAARPAQHERRLPTELLRVGVLRGQASAEQERQGAVRPGVAVLDHAVVAARPEVRPDLLRQLGPGPARPPHLEDPGLGLVHVGRRHAKALGHRHHVHALGVEVVLQAIEEDAGVVDVLPAQDPVLRDGEVGDREVDGLEVVRRVAAHRARPGRARPGRALAGARAQRVAPVPHGGPPPRSPSAAGGRGGGSRRRG